MATGICPSRFCIEPGIHGHGTDARYLPRSQGPRAPAKMEVSPPPIGGFDAALYAAYRAGVESEFERYDTDDNANGFHEWRAQWHGEWVTE